MSEPRKKAFLINQGLYPYPLSSIPTATLISFSITRDKAAIRANLRAIKQKQKDIKTYFEHHSLLCIKRSYGMRVV